MIPTNFPIRQSCRLLPRHQPFFVIPFLFYIVSLFLIAGGAQAQTKTTIQEGLKEAGWATVPTFLDAATENITIKFPKALGGGTLKFGGTIDADALRQKKFIFTTSDDKLLKWDNAFGMSFLDLTDVAMTLTASKGTFEIELDGKLGGAFKVRGKPREVVIQLAVEDKKLQNFALSLPNSSLGLHAIPDLKYIPGATRMTITSPTISKGAIGGKIKFRGDTLDAVAFYDSGKKSWNVGLNLEKPITLGKLVGHDKGLLKDVVLPQMRLLSSTKGLTSAYADLPLAMQQFFEEDGKLPEGDLELASGINVISQFDPGLQPKLVKNALAKIGIVEPVEIDGTVEGVFGGDPGVKLDVQIEIPSKHGFPFLKAKAGAETELFIELSKEEQGVGFRTSVDLKSKKETLIFDVDFELVDREGAVEVQVAGDMRGDWKDAAGIHGLTLKNPFLSVGINETAGFDLLIDGTIDIGKEEVRASADLVVLPEAGFVPEAFAFAGTLNVLPMSEMIAEALKHTKIKTGGLSKLDAEFKNIAFAFMTPGAHLPVDLEEKLSIEGAGMAIAGALWAKGKELGSVKGHVSTEGISFDGKLDPIHFGPLTLKGAELEIEGGPKTAPLFLMKGDFTLFKGFEEKFVVELSPKLVKLSTDTKFGGAFDAELTIESDGFKKGSDLDFEAHLDLKYHDIFKNLTKDALKGFKKADSALKKDEDKVKNAEKKVKGLKSKIDRAKKKAKAAVDKAVGKLNDAKKKVDSLGKQITSKKKQIHDHQRKAKHDAKHIKLAKAGKEEAIVAGLEVELKALQVAKKTADFALNAAKKVTKVGNVVSPEVAALKVQLGTEEAGLKVAEAALIVARGVNTGVEKATEAVLKAGSAFKLNSLGASGSLRGILTLGKQGHAPTLIVDVTLGKKRHVYHASLAALEKGFAHLAKEIAKSVAKDLLKIFQKKK